MRKIVVSAIMAIALGAAIPAVSQATTYFKIADEWGTIQQNGARTGVNGIRFWTAEGPGQSANFRSTAPVRFYMADIVDQANAEFGVGQWEVTNVNIVFSQSNAAFTTAGTVDLFWFENDLLPITNGESDTASAQPGHFQGLGASPLRYDSNANALHTKLADGTTDPTTIFGDYSLIDDSYSFTSQGTAGDWPTDVLASVVNGDHSLINPEDPNIVVGSPHYGHFPPITNPSRPFRSDTLANFDAYSQRVGSNLDIGPIAADLAAGADALSFLLVAEGNTAASYRGGPFSGDYPARIYLEIEQITAPAGLDGDYNDDGIVDAADYVVWQKFNGTSTTIPNDPTAGSVDPDDLGVWAANFGKTSGIGSGGSSNVPEPATSLALAIALAISSFKRRRGSV